MTIFLNIIVIILCLLLVGAMFFIVAILAAKALRSILDVLEGE